MAYDAGVFVQIDSKDGANHLYLCTCGTNIDAKELVGGVSTRTYLSGYILSEIQVSGSMDISGGWGGLASASDCSIEIADDDSGTLAKGILNDSWSLVGGLVSVAHRTPDGVMHPLYQFVVTEPGLNEDGSIAIASKTPSATRLEMMHKSTAVPQLLTGPDDPANPTDPDYLETSSANVTAGTAFGGVPVSLKAGVTLPVCKLLRWDVTDLLQGDIATSGVYAFVASGAGTEFTKGGTYPNKSVYSGSIVFRCRANVVGGDVDMTQADAMKSAIDDFIAAGYKIILSDGNWFCDILAESGWVGLVELGTLIPHTATGERYGAAGDYSPALAVQSAAGVWFSLYNAAGQPLYPPDGIDPEAVGIYAVPRSIPVAAAQYVIDGFARNKTTTPATGSISDSSGVRLFSPTVSNESSILAVNPIKDFQLRFGTSSLAALDHTGGVENPLSNGFQLMSGAGEIEAVKTDPTTGWNGGTSPIWFKGETRSSALARMWARVKCAPNVPKVDADFISFESTWKATYTAAPGFTRSSVLAAAGPLEKSPTEGIWHTFAPSEVYTVSRTANKAPVNPRWERTFASLSECKDNGTPMVESSGALPHMQSVRLDVMECFAYAYSKFGLSSIYSTVYPFWTRANCARLAYGAGTIIAGGVGRGTEIQPNGAITWATFDLPVPFGGAATVTGTAYGVIGSAPYWVSVGYITTGATQTPACWISDDDGITWRQDAVYQATSIPTAVRYVNGQFVATRTDGKIDIAAGFSSPNLIWSEAATGATQLNDIAFGAGYYLLVGNGGQARYTSNLSSFVSWSWTGGDDLTCACYSQSLAGGYFHVGVNSESVGTIYRKYDGTLPDWTAAPIPGGFRITAIMDSDGDVVAMGSEGVWARSPGYPDAAWKLRASIDGNTAPVGGVAFSAGGNNLLAVGANAQILTSPTFNQGASAGSAIPEWTPWGTKTPWDAMDQLICQKLGGKRASWNPVKVNGRSPIYQEFGIAFPPPDSATDKASGTTVREAAAKICKEWWLFAGDMPAAKMDGSADAIQAALPDVKLGNREDVCTQITAQYQPFGGDYLGKAYIQNVDKAYATGNDAFYFGGWDLPGSNTFGLILWQRCRDAYLATGILRDASLTFDSVQGSATLGALWTMEDQDLGERILWLCRQPRYYKITVDGNESAAALAFPGCRYKPNLFLLSERGLSLGITGYGLVVEASHDPINAAHTLTIAFPPEQP